MENKRNPDYGSRLDNVNEKEDAKSRSDRDSVTIISSDSSNSISSLNTNSFEDLLKICGDGGIWQIKIFLLASYCGFMTAFHNLVYAFIGAVPKHWCEISTESFPGYTVDQLKNLTIPKDSDDKYEKCEHYAVDGDWASGNFSLSDIHRDRVESCNAFDFDDSIFKSTIATEWNLVCEDGNWISTVQAMYMFGILCGSPIFGALSDKLGRKKTILGASIVFVIAAPLISLSQNFTMMMVGRFILGASSPGIYGTSFVLVIEVIGLEWRGLAGNLFCLPFAMGYMVLPGVAYFLRDWRNLQLALSAPAIILIITWWFLPESPRWLLRKGRHEEAETILRSIARSNNKNKKLPSNFSDLVARVGASEKEDIQKEEISIGSRVISVLKGYADLLSSPRMRIRTLVIYFSWMSISMVYYGIALNSPNLSTDIYLYTFISGVLEIPSYFMVPPLIGHLGRRPVFSGLLLICGASLLSSLAFSEGSVGIVVLALVGKLLIGSAYALVYLYATEIFPTLLRTYGLGTASMIGRIGSVTAPFIVDIVGKGNKSYPMIVFGVLSLVSGTLALLLPETRNKSLPETVQDIEAKKIKTKMTKT